MENPTNKLTFRWTGDEKGKKGMELMMAFGNQQIGPIRYAEEYETEIPISGGPMEIKVLCGQNGKHKTCIKHTFQFEHGKDYESRLSGKYTDISGLALQMSNGDECLEESAPACRNDLAVAMISFAFPIYGIICAARSKYNRAALLNGAGIGFVLATIFSAMADDKIGFGIGRNALFEYEPFSLTDIVINLLVGGISSVRGFLYMLF